MEETNQVLAVIDGDILAFQCAAATEKRSVIAKHNETLDTFEFDTATLFKEWAGEEADMYALEAVRTPQPFENTITAMKTMLESILQKCKATSYHIVLSGNDNFRKAIALPTQYKSTRSDAGKPVNLALAKEYLIKHHRAEVAVGEADEVLVAYAYDGYRSKRKVVQCSIDKDARHGPGWLYNWDTMSEPELIEGFGSLYLNDKGSVKGEGRMFLYYQMLFGDPVDCYKPCEIAAKRFGEKSAFKVLKDCTDDKSAVQALVDTYKTWYPDKIWYTAWDGKKHEKSWVEIWQMYADCAFMPRWDGDRLDVVKLLEKLGIPQ